MARRDSVAAVKRLDGNYALVTGGASGIGAACAQALADEGAGVLACSRRIPVDKAVATPGFGTVSQAHLDVTDEAAVEQRIGGLPQIDILVCSAGNGTFGPAIDMSVAALREMLDVHIIGAFICARAALRRMQARRRGHIIVIGSHAAHHAFAECSGYTAAKAGQLGLVRVLAAEARQYDIRVTALLPGATDTAIWDDRPGFDRSKMLRPSDVAGLLVSLVTQPQLAVEEVVVTPPAGVL